MNSYYLNVTKRVFDFLGSILLLVCLSPLIVLVSIGVKLSIGTPIFFRQKRIGYLNREFTIYKFRTMSDERDIRGNLLPDIKRLTRFGGLIRSLSLDEIPQLINVLNGEMSFIGPRPLLVRYLDRYTPQQLRRHEVKPGITGWAQVNGRNAISWEEKFKMDIWYINNVGVRLDIRITLLTLMKVIRRSNISQVGHATMEEFFGTKG